MSIVGYSRIGVFSILLVTFTYLSIKEFIKFQEMRNLLNFIQFFSLSLFLLCRIVGIAVYTNDNSVLINEYLLIQVP